MVVLDVYRNICLKHNVSFQADGSLLSIDDFAIDHPDSCQERVRNFYSSHMKMSRELQDFDFTIEEETLLRAIFIMSPGLFSVFCLKLYAAISFEFSYLDGARISSQPGFQSVLSHFKGKIVMGKACKVSGIFHNFGVIILVIKLLPNHLQY